MIESAAGLEMIQYTGGIQLSRANTVKAIYLQDISQPSGTNKPLSI